MKFITVFAAILSVAFGYQTTWTVHELSNAIQSPYTSAAVLPYLETALNQMMAALHAGEQIEAVPVTIPALDLTAMTIPDLSNALQDPKTEPAMIPYLGQALNEVVTAVLTGQSQVATPVIIPAMEVSLWTLDEISAALESPVTNPVLVPYLENALNVIMDAMFAGHQVTSVCVTIPVGVPLEVPVEIPVQPVDVPTLPIEEAPAAPSAPSSALVQIIINVNTEAAVAPSPVEVPVKPEPVIVVEKPIITPEPVIVVEGPPAVSPVIVASPEI
ncbi:BCL-6 corepressor-like protein 1 [Bombyx mandarina]|uniref:BCL-6 corepressor-like protein 1 n=1 Tax=Bombyx mandarina TaxID=7092 RepID=A0A6J2KK18_BOMMA|nr:BCL-6 corepressor-like protein 1 [Bombyx mandarina]